MFVLTLSLQRGFELVTSVAQANTLKLSTTAIWNPLHSPLANDGNHKKHKQDQIDQPILFQYSSSSVNKLANLGFIQQNSHYTQIYLYSL